MKYLLEERFKMMIINNMMMIQMTHQTLLQNH